MTKNKNIQKFYYKYKDGRFLKISYMGDGDYELILTNKKLTTECIFKEDWSLSEILNWCDGVYDDSGEYIADTLNESDFTKIESGSKKNKNTDFSCISDEGLIELYRLTYNDGFDNIGDKKDIIEHRQKQISKIKKKFCCDK